jgi:4-diphosphocytidyl-2-C-methyl-D-erythritol kinase
MTALEPGVLPRTVTAFAPAKVNLSLEILGKRSDGFHELRSVVFGLGLADRVEVCLRNDPGIGLSCSDASLGRPDNLAYRAAALLASRYQPSRGVSIRLEKSIPVAGGLGGGSSDAATTLMACNAVWGLGLSREELAGLGSELGSDVALFFQLPAALMTGRGEEVRAIRPVWSGWALLVFSGPAVSTKAVYGAFRREDASDRRVDPGSIERATSALALAALLVNDLEPAVFRVCRRVQEVFEPLNRNGFAPFRVSGAGSTLYRLYDDYGEAVETGRRIETEVKGVATQVVSVPHVPGDPEYNE